MDLQRGHVHPSPRVHFVGSVGTAAVALAICLAAPPAAAQSSVEVSPLRVELNTGPNGQTTQAVTITNTGQEAVRVRAELSDWFLTNGGSPQFAPATDLRYSATSWVRIAPPEQVIEANHDAVVRFTLGVPAETAPAGYRTAILFDFEPATTQPVNHGHQLLIKSRIATLIYVNVGEPPIAVDLTDLQIRQRPNQPTQVVAQLKNTGRRSVRTRGTLSVYDGSGALVRQSVVPDVPVLPESEREVAITALDSSQPALIPGTYRVEVRIDVGAAAVLVGETTLKVP